MKNETHSMYITFIVNHYDVGIYVDVKIGIINYNVQKIDVRSLPRFIFMDILFLWLINIK